MKLIESGFTTKWYKKYIPGNVCEESSQTKATSLTLNSLTGAFFILIIGFVLASLSFVIEIILKRKTKTKVVPIQVNPKDQSGSDRDQSHFDRNETESVTDHKDADKDQKDVAKNQKDVAKDQRTMDRGDSGIELQEFGGDSSSSVEEQNNSVVNDELSDLEYTELGASEGQRHKDSLGQKPMTNNFLKRSKTKNKTTKV